MLFVSYIFLYIFLPISVCGYYLLAHFCGAKPAKIWLCVASFVFYGWWNPALVLLLLGSIVFNYVLSLFLVGGGSADDAPWRPAQGTILTFGVLGNLGLLFHYKYLFPLLAYFHHLGWSHVDFGSVILPLGISFFTFTQIGYLVDCREGVVKDRSLLDYVLFVTFFPHLIAGPILHHREIMPQFADDKTYRLKMENIGVGLTLFTIGAIKKVMFADGIARWAEAGFAHVQGAGMLQAWSGALAYSMQLYFDFSGYSDMALGLGVVFGIRLPLNFNSPYKALSIIDFWQRWHMTLTRYLTLLVYNPIALAVTRHRQRAGLTMNKQAAMTPTGFASMIALPTFSTMLLAGIWHGAGFQFFVYGLLQAFYLSSNHAWRLFHKPYNPAANPFSAHKVYSVAWRLALTYGAVLVTQITFRANNLTDAIALVSAMLGANGSGLPLTVPAGNVKYLHHWADWLMQHRIFVVGLRQTYDATTRSLIDCWLYILGLGAIAFIAPNAYQILNKWSPALNKVKACTSKLLTWQPYWPVALATGVLLFVTTLHLDRAARFLYFQF